MSRRKSTTSRYVPPYHYTDKELLEAEIADLETDIRCAIRDGQPDYAEECSKKLARLQDKLCKP
jgi:hypothetical protein